VYDAVMCFPGSIDGTACVGGGGEPPSLSEPGEDMVVEVSGDRGLRSKHDALGRSSVDKER
jgi:hypothetical protein